MRRILTASLTVVALAALVLVGALIGRPIGGGSTAAESRVAEPLTPKAELARLDGLGAHYLQRTRETYDFSNLQRANDAFHAALQVDARDPAATLGLASIAGTQHRFVQAVALAHKASRLGAEPSATLGLAADALAEQGRYDAAYAGWQRAVDLRPDLSSYARAARGRYLSGDLEGAAQLLQLAVSAGAGLPENVEWARVELGLMRFRQGRLDAADAQFRQALRELPGYHRALVGRAQVAAARGQLGRAEALLENASRRVPSPDYLVLLGDIYTLDERRADAQAQYQLVRAQQRLFAATGGRPDLELALFDATHGRPAAAVRGARVAYRERRSIQGAEVLGLALARDGQCRAGLPYSERSLRLGTQDAGLLYHAASVEACAGRQAAARRHLGRALALNPQFSPLEARDAAALARRLGMEVPS